MSITTTRMSSGIVENSWSWLFSSSLFSSRSSSIIKQQRVGSKNDDVFWMWTALGLSVYGLKLCNDALELYKVSSAWNRRWRRRHRLQGGSDSDEHQLPSTNQSLERRKLQMEKALTTTTYGQQLQQNQIEKNGNTIFTNQAQGIQQPREQIDDCTTSASSTHAEDTTCQSKNKILTTIHAPLDKTCAICLEDFESDDEISFSKRSSATGGCRHIFHKECLHAWLEKHTSCPTCRHRMVADPEPMPWLLTPNR